MDDCVNVCTYLRSTGLLSVEEGWPQCGIGAEIMALSVECNTHTFCVFEKIESMHKTQYHTNTYPNMHILYISYTYPIYCLFHIFIYSLYLFIPYIRTYHWNTIHTYPTYILLILTLYVDAFDYLDAPPERVTGADVPMPYAPSLYLYSLVLLFMFYLP